MRPLALLVLVVFLAACGGDDEGAATGTTTGGEPEATALITTADEEVELSVEVADDEAERARGLMLRTSLPDDAGMVFLYPKPTEGSFWMKNTLIPLSIAFADAGGTILRILDMEPCEADPCEIYDPGVFYRSALEVNKGAFDRLGVEEGDRLRLEQR
jgi:uncharacterized protein